MKSSDYLLIQKKILIEKNFLQASELLDVVDLSDIQKKELKADILFYENDFSLASLLYNELGDLYKEAYCYLLSGNMPKAHQILEKALPSPAQNWSLFFCQVFTQNVTVSPSYLQIRAFLERDLSAFLKLNLVEYVQKIIDISEYLFAINPETNKIIARTFLYNDYPTYAKEYFNRAFEFTTEDAELYYLSGLYYLKINDLSEARSALRKAIALNDNYIPAKELLEKIKC